jgi:hypothetical protein
MVPTGIGDREFPSHQTIEEVPSLLPVDDASEGSGLARQADTGVLHDGHQETRLTLSEAVPRNASDAVDRTHRSTSSA